MRTSTSSYLLRLSLALAASLLTLSLVSQTQAAPTVRPFGGVTSVQLSEDLLVALGDLNITPGTIEPGALSEGVARFPISGGGLDQATLRGDIFHLGGLSLSDASGTLVQLLNFIIDTSDEQAVITGLVTVNGDLVDRIPLFNLNLTSAQVERSLFSLTVRDATLLLAPDAADALNAVFEVEAFVAGFNVGVAEVSALF
jgi:hypothetical protein